jgi:hypothetical protein
MTLLTLESASSNSYLVNVRRLMISQQRGLTLGMNSVESGYLRALDDIVEILPRTGVVTSSDIANIMRGAAIRLHRARVDFVESFQSGVTRQSLAGTKLMSMFETAYLPYGSQIPVQVGTIPLLRETSAYADGLIERVNSDVLKRLRSGLRLASMGTSASDLAVIMSDPKKWASRVRSIFLTEQMRVFSFLADLQLDDIRRLGPVKKQWLWSHVQRREHQMIDGQIRDFDELFDVPLRGGNMIQMRFPRDPNVIGFPSAVVNCRCIHIPLPAGEL